MVREPSISESSLSNASVYPPRLMKIELSLQSD